MIPEGSYRLLRSHNCTCGFRNEEVVATIKAGEDEPDIDMDELEVCPRCSFLVPVSDLLRLPTRSRGSR